MIELERIKDARALMIELRRDVRSGDYKTVDGEDLWARLIEAQLALGAVIAIFYPESFTEILGEQG